MATTFCSVSAPIRFLHHEEKQLQSRYETPGYEFPGGRGHVYEIYKATRRSRFAKFKQIFP